MASARSFDREGRQTVSGLLAMVAGVAGLGAAMAFATRGRRRTAAKTDLARVLGELEHRILSEDDLTVALRQACEGIRASLGLESVRLARPDGGGLVDILDPANDPPGLALAESALAARECRGQGQALAVPLLAGATVNGVLTLRGKAASTGWLRDIVEPLAGRLALAISLADEQHRLRLLGAAIEVAANAIFITDSRGRIEWVNEAFLRLSGHEREAVLGTTPRLLRSGAQPPSLYENLWRTIQGGQVWRGEMVECRKDGSLYTVDQTITPMCGADGQVVHFVVVQEDITARKTAEEQIRYLSDYDPLTALPNRIVFLRRLGEAIDSAEGERLAVLFVDLDRFTRVNDALGHDLGDRVLVTIANRIQASAPDASMIARVGGDEFAVLQAGDSRAIEELARELVAALVAPMAIEGHEVRVGVSIGIALYPDNGQDADILVRHADLAMYHAIREAPNGFRFFSSHLGEQVQARRDLDRDLRRALRLNQLELHYQPQLEAATGRITALEALLRWHHPQLGLVPPSTFIPIAEQSGEILAIGDWVVREACRQLRQWRDDGVPVVPVAVNLSPDQLRDDTVAERIAATVAEAGISPDLLELELTETTVMRDGDAAADLLRRIHGGGIRLAVDDFGTGYASLDYLRRFPVFKLKIDQSFVRHVVTSAHDAEIARHVIVLGHSLGIKVVAEGVETEEQLEHLRREGVDAIQGFLFARAMPAPQVASLLRDAPFERTAS
jgi:diguanylate cyclase (GGDEF)-like protein/PAS domain S-box-containing protein